MPSAIARLMGSNAHARAHIGAFSSNSVQNLSRPHRILILACIAWTLALLAAGPWLHPMEGLRGESDHYTLRAEHLRRGVITDDHFHPFLFIELTCLASFFTGDAFVAGRTVSSLFAGLLLYFSSRMALRLLGTLGGFWTFVLVAANPHYFVLGMQAASDVTGAALLLWALWRTCFVRAGGLQTGITGLAWGLAIATRFNFVLLLPIAALQILRTSAHGQIESNEALGRRRVMHFLCGAFVGYLPNLIPSLLASGQLYPSYNWRNLSFKASGNWNPVHLYNPPYSGAGDLLMQQWDNLLLMGFTDMLQYWKARIGDQVLGLPGLAWASVTASLALAASTLWSLAQRGSRELRHLATFLVAGTASVAFTFHTDMRLVLFALPLGIACLIAALHRSLRERHAWASAMLGLPLLLLASSAPKTLSDFYDHHAFEEIELAQKLSATLWRMEPITSGMSTLGRYIHNPTTVLTATGLESRSAKDWLEAAEKHARKQASSLILCGQKTTGFTVEQFLEVLPDSYEVLMRNEKALAIQLPTRSGTTWQTQVSATRVSQQEVIFELRCEPEQRMGAVGLLFIMEDADDIFLRLDAQGQGVYSARLAVADGAKGPWKAVAHAIKGDGSIIRASPTLLELH